MKIKLTEEPVFRSFHGLTQYTVAQLRKLGYDVAYAAIVDNDGWILNPERNTGNGRSYNGIRLNINNIPEVDE